MKVERNFELIALIVLNYNDHETTEEFVKSIESISLLQKIIVVDNCSTDDSYDQLIRLQSEKIEVLKTSENAGYASGNNFGAFYAIKKYDPEYLIISNPDVIFTEETVSRLYYEAKKHEDVGAVSCRMECNPGINMRIAWKRPNFKNCIIENLILYKKVMGDPMRYDEHYFDSPVVKVDVLPGSLFMIRADVFNLIGGFDENTFLYYEENILSQRLKRENLQNYLLTDCSYFHNHSTTINKNISSVKKRLEIEFQGRYYYCKEYLKCGKIRLFILKCAFRIGLFDYLLALKITNQKR